MADSPFFIVFSFEQYCSLPYPFFSLISVLTDGVVTVTIPNTIRSNASRDATIRDDVTTALSNASIFAPSSAHHIMYCLPPGNSGTWITYAYINHWNSVYNNEWCTCVSTDKYPCVIFTFASHQVSS